MNLAYLHVIMSHLPIIGIPVALCFLIWGVYTGNRSLEKFSLLALFGLAVAVLPVFLTGEPAEDFLEKLPGISGGLIEAHEDIGVFSLTMTLVAGGAAFAAFWFQHLESKRRLINIGVIVLAILSIMSLLYTAKLGGQIRHTEFQSLE